ncbi:hypothetical protein CLOM_g18452 [Closterium sp. NIES-68]|nr:hypothetical protein CLOM_g18452 [Closterium sp. NIES-68]GJP57951.1 hypothetical protein CLOP_g19596 [Closterium sp. NIES-67]
MPAAPPPSCALLPPLLVLGVLSSLCLALVALHYALRRRLSPPRALKRAAALCLLYTLALTLLTLPAPLAPAFSPCAAPRARSTRELGEEDEAGGGKEVGGEEWTRGEVEAGDGAGNGIVGRAEMADGEVGEKEGEWRGEEAVERERNAGEWSEERAWETGEEGAGEDEEVKEEGGVQAGRGVARARADEAQSNLGSAASDAGDSDSSAGGGESKDGGRGVDAEAEATQGTTPLRPTTPLTRPASPRPPPPLLAPSPPHSTLSLAPPSSPPSSPLHPPPPSSSLLPALSPSSLPASPVVSNSSSTPFSPSPPLALSPSTQRARARFLLYRLLGNDMAPLQCGEQLLRNTLYSLQHEPPHLPGCRRLWVLNHLVNATTQAATVKALKDHGVNDQDILIRALNLSLIATLDPSLWTIAVTAQNEARNFMLEHGRREGAQWVLAFDGNQFVTEEAWRLIVQAADRHEKRGLKVFKVPMYRVHQAQDPSWLNASSLFLHLRRFAPHLHESQVAFRGDSPHRYQPGLGYGRDNKMELLARVCGSGRFRKKHFRMWQVQAEQERQAALQQAQGEQEGQQHEEGQQGRVEEEVRGGESVVGVAGLPEIDDDDDDGDAGGDGEGERAVDKGQCGCHREVGLDAGYQRGKQLVAYDCGYTIRLWYFPCAEVDVHKMLLKAHYRSQLRDEGTRRLHTMIEQAIAEPHTLDPHRKRIS